MLPFMRFLTFFVFIAVIPFFIGCGPKRPEGMPETVPCTVTVLEGGTPMAGVIVTLRNDTASSSLLIEGTTNSAGVAEISSTWGNYTAKGAPIGPAKVTLNKPFEIPPPTASEAEMELWTMEQSTKYLKEREEMIDKLRIIPKIVSVVSQSPLTVSVESGSGATLTVDINDYKK